MKIMAVDYGDTRTGLATCDRGELLASPAGTITQKSLPKTVDRIIEQFKASGSEMIVVGLPLNMNGSEGERAQICRYVAELLEEQLPGVPIRMWDERGTTKTAIMYMNETDVRGKRRKALLDGESAAVILDSYLSYRKNHPDEI